MKLDNNKNWRWQIASRFRTTCKKLCLGPMDPPSHLSVKTEATGSDVDDCMMPDFVHFLLFHRN